MTTSTISNTVANAFARMDDPVLLDIYRWVADFNWDNMSPHYRDCLRAASLEIARRWPAIENEAYDREEHFINGYHSALLITLDEHGL